MSTHIDHQLCIVLGTLREQKLLDNTVLLFTSDHGDMLGKHGLWAKKLYYEESSRVPMIIVGAADGEEIECDSVDDRLVGWQDIMPTLLQLAGISIPESVQGQSMLNDTSRDMLYGELGSGARATRMVHVACYKLIYYPAGNQVQLFDLEDDPEELVDIAGHAETAAQRADMEKMLIGQLSGPDQGWVVDNRLVGVPF